MVEAIKPEITDTLIYTGWLFIIIKTVISFWWSHWNYADRANETDVAICIYSYYKSVEILRSCQPRLNMMKQNPACAATPSGHSAALHSDSTWQLALLPRGKLLAGSPDLDPHLSLLPLKWRKSSVHSGQQSWSSSETWFGEEPLHDPVSVGAISQAPQLLTLIKTSLLLPFLLFPCCLFFF